MPRSAFPTGRRSSSSTVRTPSTAWEPTSSSTATSTGRCHNRRFHGVADTVCPLEKGPSDGILEVDQMVSRRGRRNSNDPHAYVLHFSSVASGGLGGHGALPGRDLYGRGGRAGPLGS